MPRKNRQKSSESSGTSTSAFGSPGRSSHDASAFYNSQLYVGLSQGDPAYHLENTISPHHLDQIFCASAERMAEIPDHSVHLVVTSPPYNVGKLYDRDLTLDEYLEFLRRVWQEVHRVLVPGGRACINVANLGRKPYIPLHAYLVMEMQSLGFLMRGEIIWNKAASASPSTAWGSWRSPSNPTLRDVHEYVLIFCKGSFQRKNPAKRPATIQKDDFLEWTRSVWTFPAEPARKIGHPAPFPMEMPRRLIELYTYAGEVVLDPFMGSGQTALAALHSGRHYLGYEIDPDYVTLAGARIREYLERKMTELSGDPGLANLPPSDGNPPETPALDPENLAESIPTEVFAAIQAQDETAFQQAMERLSVVERQRVAAQLAELQAQADAEADAWIAGLPQAVRTAILDHDEEHLQAALKELTPGDAQAILEQLEAAGWSEDAGQPEADLLMAEFEPLVLAVVSVTRGNTNARPQLEELLADLDEQGWQLSAVVQRIWAGERDRSALCEGLDRQNEQIVHCILDQLG